MSESTFKAWFYQHWLVKSAHRLGQQVPTSVYILACYKVAFGRLTWKIPTPGKVLLRMKGGMRRCLTASCWCDEYLMFLFILCFRPWVESMKIIRDGTPNMYMVLIKFRNQVKHVALNVVGFEFTCACVRVCAHACRV